MIRLKSSDPRQTRLTSRSMQDNGDGVNACSLRRRAYGSIDRTQYNAEYRYYIHAVKKERVVVVPNMYQVMVAAENLGLEAALFASKSAWLRPLHRQVFAHCVPAMRQAYVTWSGRNYLGLVHTIIHELLTILSVDSDGTPMVDDCSHDHCIMNTSLKRTGFELHISHGHSLDRNKDGNVSVNDLDLNRDGFLKVGIVKTSDCPKISKRLYALLKSEFLTLLPTLEKERLVFIDFDAETFLRSADVSWRWIE